MMTRRTRVSGRRAWQAWLVMSERPRFDLIEEAGRQWRRHWGPSHVAAMTVVTSIMRVQQILLARLNEALEPFGLTFARYEALMLLDNSSVGALPLGKIGGPPPGPPDKRDQSDRWARARRVCGSNAACDRCLSRRCRTSARSGDRSPPSSLPRSHTRSVTGSSQLRAADAHVFASATRYVARSASSRRLLSRYNALYTFTRRARSSQTGLGRPLRGGSPHATASRALDFDSLRRKSACR